MVKQHLFKLSLILKIIHKIIKERYKIWIFILVMPLLTIRIFHGPILIVIVLTPLKILFL